MTALLLTANLYGDDRIGRLDNGFKVFFIHKKGAPVVNISIGVEAGAKFDAAHPGTAHLLEHLILFRGGDRSSALRSVGADINGHTDNEAVTFEISLPVQNLSFALKFLHTMVYQFSIDEEAFESEKKILIEEMRQMRDKPLIRARSIVTAKVLKGTVYQNPLQGTEHGIKNLKYKDMVKWYHQHYSADSSSIVVVGDFDRKSVMSEIRQIYGTIKASGFKVPEIGSSRKIKKRAINLAYEDVELGYVVAGFNAPSMNGNEAETMRVFTSIISKGIYPLLGKAFINRRRTADSCDVKYVSMINNGLLLFEFKFNPELSSPSRVIATLEMFLQQMSKFRYTIEDYPPNDRLGRFDFLKYSANSQKFSRETFSEKGINMARAYSRYIVLKRWYDMAETSKVNSDSIHKMVRKYMLKGRYFSLAILPQKFRRK